MKMKLYYQDPTRKVKALARAIYSELDDFVVVGVLDASYLFVTDFVRQFNSFGSGIEGVGFYTAKSRNGTEQIPLSDIQYISGKTTVLKDRQVVLLDVVSGSGKTLSAVKKDILEVHRARSVFTSTIFVADDPNVYEMIDNQPIKVPLNQYLIGYGLDLAGRFRDLPDVYELIDDSDPDNVLFMPGD